ncbi:DNA polymerase, partial [Bacillus cereus]|uniref:DNA polymerase n=1 Tax=Bacillus cereus TaxID=1396 RepID=UPI00366E1426
MKLRLNKTQTDGDATARVKAAADRKAKATETMDDAWRRILSMKNSATDHERLVAVKTAMAEGVLGRHPSDSAKRFSKAEALRLWRELAERQREDTLRKMVEETPANYSLIMYDVDLDRVIEGLKREKEIAVDTETTGVDVYTDEIVGISFTLPTYSFVPNAELGWNVYIPFKHTNGPAHKKFSWRNMNRAEVFARLKDVLYDETIGKVLHNAMFDIAMFRRHGSDLKGVVWDTMTAMHLLNENEESFRLKDLAPKYLGVESDTFDTLFGRDAQFREVPLDIALVYAAKDTELTWRLCKFQRSHMAKMPTILEYYQTVEVPLLYVIVDLEANGYVLDLDFAKDYGEQLRKRAEELSAELIATLTPYHHGNEPLNLNSVPQMKPALSKAIGKELPNMDAKKTLKPLAKEFVVVAKLLEYKKITKLSGTYIDTLPLKQNPATKRWHSRFNPMGTVTGRFSSGKDEEDKEGHGFNVQNQPPEARPMFVAPPGKVLVGADFKAQEIRCVAYLSGEPVLINAFLEERDPYAMMASNFYKRPYEEVYKNADGSDTKERKQMKV